MTLTRTVDSAVTTESWLSLTGSVSLARQYSLGDLGDAIRLKEHGIYKD